MRKRILATILAIAILLGAFPATITFASTSSAILTVKANKSTVNPGDEVEFSVELSQTGDIAAIEAYIELPDGLTLVNGSFVAETDKATLGWDDFTVNENYLMIYGYGSIGYKETLLTLASFKCIVDADAENQLIVDVFDVSALDANMEDKYPTSVAALLNVVIPVSGLALNKTAVTTETSAESCVLTPTITPANATNKNIFWRSSDESIAIVQDGVVTLLKRGVVVITATSEDGNIEATCTLTILCSHSIGDDIPAEESTCITQGHGAYTVCSECGEIISGSDAPLPYASHQYIDNAQQKYLKTSANCICPAVYYKSCSICGATATETFTYGEVNPDNHIGGSHVENQEETSCNKPGYTGDIICNSCGSTLISGSTIEMCAHTPGATVIENGVEATCDVPGSYDEVIYCTVCHGEVSRSHKIVSAFGHTLSLVPFHPATCTKTGNYEYYYCDICEKKFEDANGTIEIVDDSNILIPTIEHNYVAIVTEPSCTERGFTTYLCNTCGNEYISDYTEELGHEYHNGICIRCGDDDPSTIVQGVFGYYNTLVWTYNTVTNVLKITGYDVTGSGSMMSDANYWSCPWSEYRSQIKTVIFGDGVSAIPVGVFKEYPVLTEIVSTYKYGFSIGAEAFLNCSSLSKVTINSAQLIGDSSFKNCSFLHEFNINYAYEIGRYAFYGCNNLSIFSIPTNVSFIGEYAFYGCAKLTDIIIPQSITKIQSYTFSGCTGIINISLPNELTLIGYGAFQNCSSITKVTIPYNPHGNTSISGNAFYGCSGITEISIPRSVNSIGDSAFYGCTNIENAVIVNQTAIEALSFGSSLKTIEMGSGITKIPDSKFSGCSNLFDVTLPIYIVEIGKEAFAGCRSLKQISFPNSVTTTFVLGEGAFKGSGLTTVVLPKYLTTINKWAFYGCSSLTEVTIGSKVTTIDYYAFSGCENLVNITFPNSVTAIYPYAFEGCKSITDIIIPGNVKIIDAWAFSNCSRLKNISLQYGVSTIGSGCFSGCSSLQEIVVPNSVTSMGGSAFSGCTALENMTLPFVGTKTNGNNYLGILFGASSETNSATYVPATLKSVILSDACTYIGYRAFYGCKNIESIIISKNITSIGNEAFYECAGLDSAIVPDKATTIGKKAFYGCIGLKNISLPNSITTIGDDAFTGCASIENAVIGNQLELNAISFSTSLKTVLLGDGITEIPQRKFFGCTNLLNINIPSSVTSIGSVAFCNCESIQSITIPDAVTYIGTSAFSGCTSMTNIAIGKGITSIEESTFKNCSSIIELIIPQTITKIGRDAFYGCSSIASITIPDSVSSIGYDAFCNCDGLISVTIGQGMTSIGNYAFSYCDCLVDITLANSITEITDGAFANCTSLTNVVLPQSITIITNSAFSGCSRLKDITIPDGVTVIGNSAFSKCNGLKIVPVGKNVTKIDKYAFSNCVGLTDITIPSTVNIIGQYAFSNCYNLETIRIPNNAARQIDQYAFSGCGSLERIYFCGTQQEWNRAKQYVNSTNTYYLNAGVSFHDFPDEWQIQREATCTLSGSEYRGCSICGKKETRTIPAHGHSFPAAWIVRTQPTCTENGEEYHLCTICQAEETRVISANGHSFPDEWIVRTYPTCLENGEEYHLCAICQAEETRVIPAHGHSFPDEWIIRTQSTCTGNGEEYHLCTICQAEETRVIPAHGHSFPDEWIVRTQPTCIESGEEYHTCPNCGTTETRTLSALGHSFNEGICSVCGEDDPESLISGTCGENLTWQLNTMTGLLRITGTGRMKKYSGNVDIPWYSIRDLIKNIIVDEGVSSICDLAFMYCKNVYSVTINSSVTEFGMSSFYGCSSIEKVNYTGSVNDWCQISFANAASNPLYYANYLYVNGELLEELLLTGNIEQIKDYAFYNCTQLSSILIPNSIMKIGEAAFCGCSGLKSIVVEPDNLIYCSKDNCLIDIATKTLVAGCNRSIIPEDDNVETIGNYAFYGLSDISDILIPDNITAIGGMSFAYCTNIQTIVIPNSVKSIYGGAFLGCSKLKSAVIPSGLDLMGNMAFYGCSEFTDLYYLSTVEKWNQLNTNSNLSASTWNNITIHFMEAEIVSPTCTEDGYTKYFCSECGYTYNSDYVPSTGHDYEIFVTDPTCEETGYTTHICKECKTYYVDEYVNALGHVSGDWETVEPATCSKLGTRVKKCTRCGKILETESIVIIPHNFIDTVTEPTQTSRGYTTHQCSECGYSYVDTYTDYVPENPMIINIETVKIIAGKEFSVDVEIQNNSGFSYLELTPMYPGEFTLLSVQNGELISDFTKGIQYIWITDEDVLSNGRLMTFTFTTSRDTEPGEYEIGFNVRSCVNYEEKIVDTIVEAGTIEILSFIYGDANGDSIINGQDIVRLKKYLANYDYDTGTSTIEIFAGADANGDGSINGQDVVRLKKYLANYDYETETSTIVLGPQK